LSTFALHRAARSGSRPERRPGPEPGAAPGARRLALGAGIVLGSLGMWVGIPTAWLWATALAEPSYPTFYALAIVGCPVTMGLWGFAVYRLNARYVRLTGIGAPRGGSAWLKSLSAERRGQRPRPLIEVSMALSVTTAVVVFATWLIVVGPNGPGAAPGAW